MVENRRVRMTKQLIKDAFCNLLENREITKITVKQICENADVNRSTFYAHYSDQYELFNEIQRDIISITPGINLYKKDPIVNELTKFFEFIHKNRKIYRILFLNSNGVHLRNAILNKLFNRNDADISWIDKEMDLASRMHFKMLMCAFGGMHMVEKWIFGEFESKPAELAAYMAQFIEKA